MIERPLDHASSPFPKHTTRGHAMTQSSAYYNSTHSSNLATREELDAPDDQDGGVSLLDAEIFKAIPVSESNTDIDAYARSFRSSFNATLSDNSDATDNRILWGLGRMTIPQAVTGTRGHGWNFAQDGRATDSYLEPDFNPYAVNTRVPVRSPRTSSHIEHPNIIGNDNGTLAANNVIESEPQPRAYQELLPNRPLSFMNLTDPSQARIPPLPPGTSAIGLFPLEPADANLSIRGVENLGLVSYLQNWAFESVATPAAQIKAPIFPHIEQQLTADITEITYKDLNGDRKDFQGIDWNHLGIDRASARLQRQRTYQNHVTFRGSDSRKHGDGGVEPSDSFFRFQRTLIRKDIKLAHFQLRNVLATPTRTQAFYPTSKGIRRLRLSSGEADLFLDLREPTFNDLTNSVSALDASHGVLVGGTFGGEYYVQALSSQDPTSFSYGMISKDAGGITNHMQIYNPRRSSSPVVAIMSNDCSMRLMDIKTEAILQTTKFPAALNCSAVSPDGRLRVVGGDHPIVLIIDADGNRVVQKLRGHHDYVFACDWSDNGWTIATGSQDMTLKIWDARRWSDSSGRGAPIQTIRSDLASARCLRFSPQGSGRPVLVAAEEADVVNIIDAKTFASKQTFTMFGEIGGVDFSDEGRKLSILCADDHRGGVIQLERLRSESNPLTSHDPWFKQFATGCPTMPTSFSEPMIEQR